ncbi:MAG: hypothetical protein GF331_16695 [Chitinivibrionales bacterium]|nr:hypothetical protein [Chitinivibrionales bacterium]
MAGICALLLGLGVRSCTYAPTDLEDEIADPHPRCFDLDCADSSIQGTWLRATTDLLICGSDTMFVWYQWSFGHCEYSVRVEELDTAGGWNSGGGLYTWTSSGYWTATGGTLRFSDSVPPAYGLAPGPLKMARAWSTCGDELLHGTLTAWHPGRHPLCADSGDGQAEPLVADSAHYTYELQDSSSMLIRYFAMDSLVYAAQYHRSGS